MLDPASPANAHRLPPSSLARMNAWHYDPPYNVQYPAPAGPPPEDYKPPMYAPGYNESGAFKGDKGGSFDEFSVNPFEGGAPDFGRAKSSGDVKDSSL